MITQVFKSGKQAKIGMLRLDHYADQLHWNYKNWNRNFRSQFDRTTAKPLYGKVFTDISFANESEVLTKSILRAVNPAQFINPAQRVSPKTFVRM
jgi:NADH dehydrogenase/NADH:ubiquinone oxidoreductase subunit G